MRPVSRLYEIVGEDDGWTATGTEPVRVPPAGHPSPASRYAQECGPVETRPLVTWLAASRRRRCGYPALTVGEKTIGFNRQALDLLGRPRFLKAGITFDGRLAVAPAGEDDAEAYRVTCRGKSAAAVTLPKAAKALAEAGISGRYRLVRDDKLGLFVGEPV